MDEQGIPFAEVVCGAIPPSRVPKVVGGAEAAPFSNPFVGAFTRTPFRGGPPFVRCGVVVVDANTLLTSAHCASGTDLE